MVVFGSDYRTPAGHVAPQRSTQTLLEGGPTAVAIAPAELSPRDPIGGRSDCSPSPDDDAAIETAHELADHFGAT